MLTAQGVDLDAFNNKLTLDHTAVAELQSPSAGFVSRCDARLIGGVIRDLGGGRITKESVIIIEAGVDRLVPFGEPVNPSEVIARVHAADRA
jgi:thymidine phosphorylase